jgi:uncharacterized hydantoinase/oxoprolinase family protein
MLSRQNIRPNRSMQHHLRTHFATGRKFETIYAGGKVQMTSDGSKLACMCEDEIFIMAADSGDVLAKLAIDEEVFLTFAISGDDKTLAACMRETGRMVVWDLNTFERTKVLKVSREISFPHFPQLPRSNESHTSIHPSLLPCVRSTF